MFVQIYCWTFACLVLSCWKEGAHVISCRNYHPVPYNLYRRKGFRKICLANSLWLSLLVENMVAKLPLSCSFIFWWCWGLVVFFWTTYFTLLLIVNSQFGGYNNLYLWHCAHTVTGEMTVYFSAVLTSCHDSHIQSLARWLSILSQFSLLAMILLLT
jgi:hypothetical protein